jgi:hypothetical protein
MIRIGFIGLSDEYVIGFAALKSSSGDIYGFFIGSWGIGWIYE